MRWVLGAARWHDSEDSSGGGPGRAPICSGFASAQKMEPLPSPCPAGHTGPAPAHQPFWGTRNGVTPRPSPSKTQAGGRCHGAVPALLGLSGRQFGNDPHGHTPADYGCPPPLRAHVAAARRDSECRAPRCARLCRKPLCIRSVPQAPAAGAGAGNHQCSRINQRLGTSKAQLGRVLGCLV